MKTGDTRKVIVLASIAVVVITVAVIRSIPAGDVVSNAIAAVQKGSDSTSQPTELPKLVLTNPFFHTKLISKVEPAAPEQPGMVSSGGTALKPVGGDLPAVGGQLPQVGTQPLFVKPEDVPGAGQQSNTEPKKLLIVLEAVLKARTSLAMVSVDGGAANARAVGDVIGNGVRIVGISQEEVVLSTPKGKRRLAVGRRLEL